MPIIASDDHPDCYIECPGSGFAIYVLPYGPCETGCDPERFGTTVLKLFGEQGQDLRFAGRFVGVSGSTLAQMALDLRGGMPDFTDDARAWVEELTVSRGKERFEASWGDSSIAEFMALIATATGNPAAPDRPHRRAA